MYIAIPVNAGVGPGQALGDEALWRMPPQTHRASYTIPTDEQLVQVSTHMRNASDLYRLANRLGFFESELQVSLLFPFISSALLLLIEKLYIIFNKLLLIHL